ncbi:uncharacterized mitochondrial protein AtMg00810-like [Gastrolobium bilobum]|uniref:uncharacterized mitochondrial protein AtMg00810-like n=1 Tax=Gastrolobium bilobum TaxID=150636 RepID=UPI002AB0EAB2|nr:uncharacterized mitochondrial protein AtMg00810-like [Gastrolobium bilobum]
MKATLHVLRYLKTAPGNGLLYSANNNLDPDGFAYSNWETCPDTRRSIIGFCVFLEISLATWRSMKQRTVSRSKHIEIDFHLIRENINDGLINLLHISSSAQLADSFTKSLSTRPFKNLVSKLGVRNVYLPT